MTQPPGPAAKKENLFSGSCVQDEACCWSQLEQPVVSFQCFAEIFFWIVVDCLCIFNLQFVAFF
jgi:hypothetical protein